jgi:hypothetical protein
MRKETLYLQKDKNGNNIIVPEINTKALSITKIYKFHLWRRIRLALHKKVKVCDAEFMENQIENITEHA